VEATAFTPWLAAIADLTPGQRGQAWRTLALAEAADSEDGETARLVQRGLASVALTMTAGEPRGRGRLADRTAIESGRRGWHRRARATPG
jgi:hypothetical protein